MTDRPGPGPVALATDLSHRCDRALDRAVLIAGQWETELLVIHVLEEPVEPFLLGTSPYDLPSWRRPEDPARTVRDRLYRDLLEEDPGIEVRVHVEAGAPVATILDAASKGGAALLVTGVARDESLGRMLLGDTVERLIRKSSLPVLIVRNRVHGPYEHFVVATDFSDSSRIALETAARFFPKAQVSLFHAYELPFAGYLGHGELDKQFDDYGREAGDKFLREAGIPLEDGRMVSRMIERGAPEALLRDYAEQSRRHLTVVGTHGGGLVYEALIGSTARKIIDAVPGDVLIVPDPGKRKAS